VVIVACPEGPAGETGGTGGTGETGETGGVPPIKTGAIPAATAQVGGTPTTVDVAKYFHEPQGEALTYEATSSKPAVATVSVKGSVVTITGVAAGTATITVSANDPGGLASPDHTFDVTVTAAGPVAMAMMPCAAAPMLKTKETCEETVASGQELESGDSSIFGVAVKKDTGGLIWVVTAKAKGKTTLRVVDKATKGVALIKQATVVNTAPERSAVVLDTTENLLEMVPQTQATTSFALDPKMDTLYTINMRRALSAYFKDADGAADLAKYDITTDTPYVIVRKYDADAGLVLVDVVNKAADSFVISIVAVDADDAKSEALTGMVRWQPARSKGSPYAVEQFDSAEFRAEDIELRWGAGVTHTLEFKHVVDPVTPRTGNTPLEFIRDWTMPSGTDIANLDPTDADEVDDKSATNPAPADLLDANDDGHLDGDAGTRWIEITATSPIAVGTYTIDDDTDADHATGPMLTFTLRGSGATEPTTGTATITITQYVIYDKDNTAGTQHSRQIHEAGSKTLTLNIVRVE
jgi:hypothetical protein